MLGNSKSLSLNFWIYHGFAYISILIPGVRSMSSYLQSEIGQAVQWQIGFSFSKNKNKEQWGNCIRIEAKMLSPGRKKCLCSDHVDPSQLLSGPWWNCCLHSLSLPSGSVTVLETFILISASVAMSTLELPPIYSFHFLWLSLKWLSLEKLSESFFSPINKMKLHFATFDTKCAILLGHVFLSLSFFPPSLLLSPLPPTLFLFFFLQTLLSPYLLSIIVERYFAINMPTWVKRSLDSPTLHICPCD